jgi:hypothetical protein
MPPPRRRIARRLLVASLGVASVGYVACDTSESPVGNPAGPPGFAPVQDGSSAFFGQDDGQVASDSASASGSDSASASGSDSASGSGSDSASEDADAGG